MNTVAIVDYGMGNLRSVAKAIEHVAPQARVLVTSDPAEVAAADRVVVPGQGAMPDCMRELDARGLRPAVIQATQSKPFLGICIGLQMLLPGQTLTFDVEWNGTSETGSRVSGDLWIAGQLIAVPGGATQALHIFIAEK